MKIVGVERYLSVDEAHCFKVKGSQFALGIHVCAGNARH